MAHGATEGVAEVPNDPAVIAHMVVRGWVLADPPVPSPEDADPIEPSHEDHEGPEADHPRSRRNDR